MPALPVRNPYHASREVGNNKTSLLFGSGTLQLEEAGDIQTDRYGVSTGTCVFKGPKDTIAIAAEEQLPIGAATHPYAPWLALEKRRVVFSPGIGQVVCEYAGCNTPSDFVYEFEAGVKEEPIQTHSDFPVLAHNYGVLYSPNTGQEFFSQTSAEWGELVTTEFLRFRNSSVIAGVDSFLDFGHGTWKATQATNVRPQAALSAVGQISTPVGNPPTYADDRPFYRLEVPYEPNGIGGRYIEVPSKTKLIQLNGIERNWLYMGFSYTQRGACYLITHSWLLSGPGGWNPKIYAPSSYDAASIIGNPPQ